MVLVGDTEKLPDVLLVTRVPPHEPVYSCHTAPVPNEPPLTVMVEEPEQMEEGVAVNEDGAVELVLTVTVTEAHEVVLQVPLALT